MNAAQKLNKVEYQSKDLDYYKNIGLYKGQNDVQRKVSFAYLISGIGVVLLFLFGIVNISSQNTIAGSVECLLSAATLINILILRSFQKLDIAFNNIILIMIVLYLGILFTGGVERTGLIWFAVFPVIVFFLKGRKEGVQWNLLFIALLSLSAFLELAGYVDLSYSIIELRQIIVSIVVLGILVYGYQALNDNYAELIADNSNELIKAVTQLIHEIKERKSVEETLSKNINEQEDQNKILTETKRAMLNILEDLEYTKKSIEKEKATDEAMISSIGDGIIAIDKNRKIKIVNQSALDMLGFKREELIGKDFIETIKIESDKEELVNPEDRPSLQSLKTGQKNSVNVIWLKKDLTKLAVQQTSSPIIQNNVTTGVILVFRDITKEKEIDRAKTEFVSLASHQLKTPLSSINWYTELLLDQDAGKLNTAQQDYMKEISKSNSRMIDLVNALLNVSRIDLGTFAIDPSPTHLDSIMKETLEDLKINIQEKGHKVIEKYDKELPEISADPKLTRIIFDNLVTNAIKYTSKNGLITISMKVDKMNKFIRVCVEDNGYGIPKDQQGKIFEKLYRADNAKLMDADGTGLGLYIIKSIVDRSGCKIFFESEENKGTKFCIEFPLSGMSKQKGEKSLA
jgi:PAS domain S-box-containing protein